MYKLGNYEHQSDRECISSQFGVQSCAALRSAAAAFIALAGKTTARSGDEVDNDDDHEDYYHYHHSHQTMLLDHLKDRRIVALLFCRKAMTGAMAIGTITYSSLTSSLLLNPSSSSSS